MQVRHSTLMSHDVDQGLDMRRKRKVAALGAVAFLVLGSSALAFPGAAVADTKSTNCGGSVTGQVGDTVLGNTSVLGLNLGSVNLGTISSGTTVLSKTVDSALGIVCTVTVTVTAPVDDVADAVNGATPDALKPVTDPVTGAVTGGTDSLRQATGATPDSSGGNPANPNNPDSGDTPPAEPVPPYVPPSNSPPYSGGSQLGWAAFPYYAGSPMSAFASFPYGDTNSLFGTAPGLKYGYGFGDYDPQFGLLGEEGDDGNPIRNAGNATALPSTTGSGIGLPMLLAVLALAGASAGLVRTWVLRVAAATAA